MIFEVATIDIKDGYEDDFLKGVQEAVPVFRRAKGCRSMRLERVIKTPSRFRLVIAWDTLEDHVQHFRNSKDFQLWRSLVQHTFAAAPSVEHTAVILTGFETLPEA